MRQRTGMRGERGRETPEWKSDNKSKHAEICVFDAVGIYIYLGRIKFTKQMICIVLHEPKTIFYFIAFAFQVFVFFFLSLAGFSFCISLNKTTRNDDDDDAIVHMASDLGGAFFFLSSLLFVCCCVHVHESSTNGLPFSFVSQKIWFHWMAKRERILNFSFG